MRDRAPQRSTHVLTCIGGPGHMCSGWRRRSREELADCPCQLLQEDFPLKMEKMLLLTGEVTAVAGFSIWN